MTILYTFVRIIGLAALGIVSLFAAIVLAVFRGCRITR